MAQFSNKAPQDDGNNPGPGEPDATGTYLITKIDLASGEAIPLSAGFAEFQGEVISGREKLSHEELAVFGIKDIHAVQRALHGDEGAPLDSSTSVGYTPRYAQNFKDAFGENKN